MVVNKGASHGLKIGDKYLIVGLGEVISDPDTGEELERLEVLKGKAEVVHVQEKISTLKSCQQGKEPDRKEIKKSISTHRGLSAALFGPQDATVESVIPGDTYLLQLDEPKIGDVIVKV